MGNKVLVIEDDGAVRGFVVRILSERGYSVQAVGTVAEATKALGGARPDLVLVDVELPDGCGLDLIGRLPERDVAKVPAIVMSTLVTEQDLTRGFAAGAADYIEKPFSASALLARCAVVLARATFSREQAELRTPTTLPQRNGLTFGRYRIERELGHGGFGKVYLAKDTGRGDALVALKVLVAPPNEDAESRLRFVRESYTLAKISSPAIAAIHDVGDFQGQLYIAMQYIEGETLFSFVRHRGPLNEAKACLLAQGLLDALIAIEAAGVVHRDLKPENVVLRHSDVRSPVLVDFGLAKLFHHRGVTKTNALFGTPAYMSPELMRGLPVDQRSDLFSLGLTLRFAIVGEDVFPQLKGLLLLSAIATTPTPQASTLLSRPFSEFLDSLLAIEPARRPPSAAAARELLAAVMTRCGQHETDATSRPTERHDLERGARCLEQLQ